MSFCSSAFIQSSPCLLRRTIHTTVPLCPLPHVHPFPLCAPTIKVNPFASFTEDFFTGPSTPPRPRPLYQVILFSITTNLLWYGYYKFCIEEELRNTTGHGPGGFLALTPFVVGVTSPLYLSTGGPAEAGVAAGVLWIVSVQYWLYNRINEVMKERAGYEPLVPWWVVIPGFNLIVGLRSVHFLSVAWGGSEDDDPIVSRLPFLGVRQLGILQMLSNPSLWLKI